MKTQPAWINQELYPFKSNWIEVENHQLHYLDEGEGRVEFWIQGLHQIIEKPIQVYSARLAGLWVIRQTNQWRLHMQGTRTQVGKVD